MQATRFGRLRQAGSTIDTGGPLKLARRVGGSSCNSCFFVAQTLRPQVLGRLPELLDMLLTVKTRFKVFWGGGDFEFGKFRGIPYLSNSKIMNIQFLFT